MVDLPSLRWFIRRDPLRPQPELPPTPREVVTGWLLAKGLVVAPVPAVGPRVDPAVVAAGVTDLCALAYEPSRDLVEQWVSGGEDVTGQLADILHAARRATGAHRSMPPFYPNFPEQVARASDAELFLNAVMHYSGDVIGLRILPAYRRSERKRLHHPTVTRPLRAATPDEVDASLATLVGQSAAMSPADAEVLAAWMARDPAAVRAALPERFTNRENLARTTSLFLLGGHPCDDLLQQLHSATDVLRLACGLCDGDLSLAEPTRFPSFPRSTRRLLLSCLETSDLDLRRHPERFKRLGSRLHPGEHADRFPRTAEAFRRLADGGLEPTVMSRLEAGLASGDVLPVAHELAADRPGELARRLDALLVHAADDDARREVVELFSGVADRVATGLLLTLLAHLRRRTTAGHTTRLFLPKGVRARSRAVLDGRPSLDESLVAPAMEAVEDALRRRFATLPPLGKAWLDPELHRLAVPLAVRNASPGLHTLGRGSRLPMPEDATTQRAFVWWVDAGDERVDLDLSVMLADEHFTRSETVSYYNLRTAGCLHSGDVTSAPAPEGAAEFVDMALPLLAKQGWRYALVTVSAFTGQDFSRLGGAMAGLQARHDAQSGEVFDPRTVTMRLDLVTQARHVLPMVIDIARREVVWVDLGLRTNPEGLINVAANEHSQTAVAAALVDATPPTLFDLYRLHARARGTLVDDPDEADVRIGPGGDVDPLDAADVLANWVVAAPTVPTGGGLS